MTVGTDNGRYWALRVFDLPLGATSDQIAAKWRDLAKKYHPDRFITPLERERATRRFQEIAEAHEILLELGSGSAPEPSDSPGQSGQQQDADQDSPDTTEPITWGMEMVGEMFERWRLAPLLGILWIPHLIPTMLMVPVGFLVGLLLMPAWAFIDNHPRLSNFLIVLLIRWAPSVIVLWIGLQGVMLDPGPYDQLWRALGWWFAISGASALVVEFVFMIWAITRLPSMRSDLDRTLERIDRLTGESGQARDN